mmetsp:Transcript_17205/g.44818  ORF Transcript_17205/g.44818 Transcript_17205/m.44818 type:complete len:266 (-) Transcript_17205:253-1050(-)
MTKLRVANPAPQRVIFKVLSTNPPRYYVKPNGGVIAEGAVLDISFSLADTSGIGDKVDKFLVEWMWDSDFPEPIPQDVDGAVGWKAFFAKVSKRNAKAVKKVKLSCRIREAGEEHDSPTRFNLAGPLERSLAELGSPLNLPELPATADMLLEERATALQTWLAAATVELGPRKRAVERAQQEIHQIYQADVAAAKARRDRLLAQCTEAFAAAADKVDRVRQAAREAEHLSQMLMTSPVPAGVASSPTDDDPPPPYPAGADTASKQ